MFDETLQSASVHGYKKMIHIMFEKPGMNLRYTRPFGLFAMACMFAMASPSIGMAASLAGQTGDVHFHPMLGGGKSSCSGAYDQYVAAKGHSAYASTPYQRIDNLYIICSLSLNAKTQQAAEAQALKSCEARRAIRKFSVGGKCQVAMSK